MRAWGLFLGLLLSSVVMGCARSHEPVEFGPNEVVRPVLASSLLFDRYPGTYRATDFNYRSDWPSTDAFYTPGEILLYSDRMTDYQGPGLNGVDRTYRRVDTVRFGAGNR